MMKIIRLNTAIVGSGAAGFNAAIRLKQFGIENIAIITENINFGTSRNTGSDKQTYYKLGLGGDAPDSVKAMANDLFNGGSVDGDNALCEAALSARSFLNLCELGVEFPTNRYGEYVGYKTDHDLYERATSVGPLTSKKMTEALQKEAKKRNVKIYDNNLVVSIIKNNDIACGLLAINTVDGKLTLFNCRNIIFATGGPAGIYKDSVYPVCHNGSSGVAFEAGAVGQNLTEWQYGLASINPRWNVSGTYMQVLPRFVSVDEKGNEYEFLTDYFKNDSECLSLVFLKGYQWPFDSRKVLDGSSVIDLLVYREKVLKNRRVFLDYRSNTFDHDIDYKNLCDDARIYLEKANACFGTPIERLELMNKPAIDLYKSKGLDLYKERLEIALCSQHNNGGIAVDLWWQTSIKNLFAVGEVAGTHGVFRPGGSALNAGQVGALRATQYIAEKENGEPISDDYFERISKPIVEKFEKLRSCLYQNKNNVKEQTEKARTLMSNFGGAIRVKEKLNYALTETKSALDNFSKTVGVEDVSGLCNALRLRETLISQIMYLSAMIDYSEKYSTRGSALYYDKKGILKDGLPECFRFSLDNGESKETVQEISFTKDNCKITYRTVRPIPENEEFFENTWRSFRDNKNIY